MVPGDAWLAAFDAASMARMSACTPQGLADILAAQVRAGASRGDRRVGSCLGAKAGGRRSAGERSPGTFCWLQHSLVTRKLYADGSPRSNCDCLA